MIRHSLTGVCYNENEQATFVDVVVIDSIEVMQSKIDQYTLAAHRYNLVLTSNNGQQMIQNFLNK